MTTPNKIDFASIDAKFGVCTAPVPTTPNNSALYKALKTALCKHAFNLESMLNDALKANKEIYFSDFIYTWLDDNNNVVSLDRLYYEALYPLIDSLDKANESGEVLSFVYGLDSYDNEVCIKAISDRDDIDANVKNWLLYTLAD